MNKSQKKYSAMPNYCLMKQSSTLGWQLRIKISKESLWLIRKLEDSFKKKAVQVIVQVDQEKRKTIRIKIIKNLLVQVRVQVRVLVQVLAQILHKKIRNREEKK